MHTYIYVYGKCTHMYCPNAYLCTGACISHAYIRYTLSYFSHTYTTVFTYTQANKHQPHLHARYVYLHMHTYLYTVHTCAPKHTDCLILWWFRPTPVSTAGECCTSWKYERQAPAAPCPVFWKENDLTASNWYPEQKKIKQVLRRGNWSYLMSMNLIGRKSYLLCSHNNSCPQWK